MLYTANVFLFQGSESPHFISKNLLQFGQFCMPNELNWCHEPQRTSAGRLHEKGSCLKPGSSSETELA